MYVLSSLIQWIGMTSQATDTELLTQGNSLYKSFSKLPQQPPLLHFWTHTPSIPLGARGLGFNTNLNREINSEIDTLISS
jgi:hypothetical protein